MSRNNSALASPWLTVGEAAKYTGLCQASLRRLILSGTIPASRAGAVLIRVHRDDIDQWLRSNPVNGPANRRDPLRNRRGA